MTPLYLALKNRGVQFEFFQRVRSPHLADDGRQVAAIRVARQVTLKGEDYQPLVDVAGLPC